MTAVPSIATGRLVLRPWRDDDLERLAAIVGDAEVARYMWGGEALDLDGARAAIQRRLDHWRDDGMGFWALELRETGELIGWTGLQRIRFERGVIGEVEVGWMLRRDWWGHGYAPEAAEASLRWGFEDADLERIFAFCHPDNIKSERVMQKLGMSALGTTTDTRDETVSKLYAIGRAEWRARKGAI